MAEVLCRCTACATKFKVDAKYAGKKARCPKCTLVVEVPAEGSEPISGSTTVVAAPTVKAPLKSQAPMPVPAPPPPAPLAPLASSSIPAPTSPAPAGSESSGGFPNLNLSRTTSKSSSSAPRTFVPPADMGPVGAQPSSAGPVAAAIADTPIEALAAEETISASDPFAIQVKKSGKAKASTTTVGGPGAATENAAAPAPRGKKSKSALPLIFGASGVLVVAMIVVGVLFATGAFNPSGTQVAKNDKDGKGTNALQTTGTLVLDWPDDQRQRAGLKINKRSEPLTKGALQFDLPPGEHTLLIQRSGYSPVEKTITITKGEVTTFKPTFEKNEFGSTGPTVVNKTPGSSGGTDFQVGMATGPTIAGFDGFTQNFYRAKEIAAKDQRDILIIFGRSDTDQSTKSLGSALMNARTQVQAFVPVIVDFPQTPEALGNIQDLAGNGAMAMEFGLRRLPTMVLLDHKGKSYYLQEKWAQGQQDVATYFQEATAARKERDELWAAVKGESLEPAAKFVNWLLERRLAWKYGDEVKQWMTVARRLDPNNEQGHLEAFVEAEVCANLSVVGPRDESGVKLAIAPLEPWMDMQRFKNEDRGARVHLEATQALGRSGLGEDAAKHLTRAGSYKPTDPDLKATLAGAKTIIERGRILSSGTGFVISEAGYILTNHHVIAGRGKVVVRLPDGKTTVDGQVIAQDDDRDMALVKIELPAGLKLTTLTIATAAAGRGSNVAALGYPGARSVEEVLTFTEGAVSALPSEATDQMLKLDVRVNPGNSGGPLCDNKGFVVGMVTAKTRTSADTDSYGMAVPSAELTKFLAKHLPPGAPRGNQAAPPQPLAWNDVDAQVSPGVLLILKME